VLSTQQPDRAGRSRGEPPANRKGEQTAKKFTEQAPEKTNKTPPHLNIALNSIIVYQ